MGTHLATDVYGLEAQNNPGTEMTGWVTQDSREITSLLNVTNITPGDSVRATGPWAESTVVLKVAENLILTEALSAITGRVKLTFNKAETGWLPSSWSVVGGLTNAGDDVVEDTLTVPAIGVGGAVQGVLAYSLAAPSSAMVLPSGAVAVASEVTWAVLGSSLEVPVRRGSAWAVLSYQDLLDTVLADEASRALYPGLAGTVEYLPSGTLSWDAAAPSPYGTLGQLNDGSWVRTLGQSGGTFVQTCLPAVGQYLYAGKVAAVTPNGLGGCPEGYTNCKGILYAYEAVAPPGPLQRTAVQFAEVLSGLTEIPAEGSPVIDTDLVAEVAALAAAQPQLVSMTGNDGEAAVPNHMTAAQLELVLILQAA